MAATRSSAARVYRMALRLYPAPFRRRFANDMTAAFEWRLRQARARGRLAVAWLTLATAADLLHNAAAERFVRRPALRGVMQDLGLSVRRMARRPADAIVTIVTFAIGIGAVATIFAIVHAVLLSPLKFPEPDQLVSVRGSIAGRESGVSYENAIDLAAGMRTIAALSPFAAQSVNLTGVAEPDRLRGGFVTSEFFGVVATPPALGRAFTPADDAAGAEPVAVLSHGAWQRRFGGAPGILSARLTLNNVVFSVVGVMPASFDFPIDEVEVWLPIRRFTGSTSREFHNFFVVARLADGTSLTDAGAEAAAMAADLERRYPANREIALRVEPLHETLTSDSRAPLGLLMGLVIVMLVAASLNVAGIRLGATLSRRREIATRAALGASRARLMTQLAGESMAAGAVGSLAGLALAAGAIALITRTSGIGVTGLEHASINLTVAAVSIAAGLLAGLFAGLLPAWQWSRLDQSAAFRDGVRTTGRSTRLRSALVVAQVAVALVMLAAAGLLVRSYARLTSTEPGFAAADVLTLEYRLPRNKYGSPAAQAAFHAAVLDRVRAVPGVLDAASVRALPFSGNGSSLEYRIAPGEAQARGAAFNTVSDRYFETMGIRIERGRAFDRRDAQAGAARAVVVSAALAQQAWPGNDPVGKQIYFTQPAMSATVVGVAADVRHAALSDARLEAIYALTEQNPGIFMTLAVKTAGAPLAFADAVRRAVWSVDADQPMWKIRTLASLVDASLARDRFLLRALLFFALSAVFLAMLATYGTVAQGVAERRREIGVRMALGARGASVLALVLRGTLVRCLIGVTAGLAVALAAAPALRAFLYGVEPADPITFGGSCLLLILASVFACWLPARRALHVNPIVALRDA